MINHKQKAAYNDPARFQYWLAGRRGGKTYAIARKLRLLASQMPYKSEMAYIGPTNQHAKELIWEPLDELFHQAGWNYRPMISKQCFYLPGRRKVYIIGAEKISRIRGHALYHAFLDELAFFQQPLGVLWRALRPTLADLRGGATLATTPDGKGTEAYEFWLEAKESPEWSTHFWNTTDNPWIDAEEVEHARHHLDERSFAQEYLAEWVSFEGLAYYSFDENINIKTQPKIDLGLPLKLLFDFNVNPTTLLLSQMDRRHDINRILAEYSQPNSSTENTVIQFCEDHKDLAGKIDIRIRGDASGNNRSSNTGRSDYYYVNQVLYEHGFISNPKSPPLEIPSKNPAIIDRVKYVNSWLKPFKGNHRVEIDPSCRDLIKDLGSQSLNGRRPSDKNNLGHKADALGYDIYWEQINTKTRTKSSIIL